MKFNKLFNLINESDFYYNEREYDNEAGYKTREFYDWGVAVNKLKGKASKLIAAIGSAHDSFEAHDDHTKSVIRKDFINYLIAKRAEMTVIIDDLKRITVELMGLLKKEGNLRIFQNSKDYNNYHAILDTLIGVIESLQEIIKRR